MRHALQQHSAKDFAEQTSAWRPLVQSTKSLGTHPAAYGLNAPQVISRLLVRRLESCYTLQQPIAAFCKGCTWRPQNQSSKSWWVWQVRSRVRGVPSFSAMYTREKLRAAACMHLPQLSFCS